jgi:hypothetical protein
MTKKNFDFLTLKELCNAPDRIRDTGWEEAFLAILPNSSLRVVSPTPQQGPDGWPYLFVASDDDASEPALTILKWLSEKGIGLAINPEKDAPDFVLPWGMIWNFRERQAFLNPPPVAKDNKFELEKGESVFAGPPSAEYLPEYVRKMLRSFWIEQGVLAPRILVMSQDHEHFDLCFSLDSLGNPPEKEHEGIAQTIAWFLPQDYSIVLVKEDGLPAFSDL